MVEHNLWWHKKYGRDKVCGITHLRLRSGKNKDGLSYVIRLPCKHSFYRSALYSWVQVSSNPTCPLCRQNFDAICVLI